MSAYAAEAEDRFAAYTPFMEVETFEATEAEDIRSEAMEIHEFESPFIARESFEGGETEALAPEALALTETVSELKDSEFRESLEQLADEALEANEAQLEGEYGDRETRDASAERLLNEHFYPLANQMEQMLDRFFERLQEYDVASLTEAEIDRVASEAMPTGTTLAPTHEQFLGGLLRKAVNLAKGAVKVVRSGVEG
ncbi:MAG TPA: hypothetical protein VJ779_15190, partial [Acetobacteraceae bacterium]|nr:hypothetical protein [Acetobacteraceae bacterium]